MQRLLVLFRSLYKYSPLSMEVLVDGLVTIAFHLLVINLKKTATWNLWLNCFKKSDYEKLLKYSM